MRLLLPALIASTLAIAACGDDDEPTATTQPPQPASFELTGSGKNAKLTGPATLEAGLVQMTFRNSGRADAGATLIRIEGTHTAAEAIKAGQGWGDQGKPLPSWIRFVGGTSEIGKGESQSALQVLEAGKYVALDIGTNAYKEFEVQGDGTGELPDVTARIEARDYSFSTAGLRAGKQQILFTNEGKEPHFAVAAPIVEGKTIADVRKFIREEQNGPEAGGKPPFVEEDAISTGLLDGGESQVIDLTLAKGSYALFCFVPDRKGGPPHAFMGMVSEGVVQ